MNDEDLDISEEVYDLIDKCRRSDPYDSDGDKGSFVGIGFESMFQIIYQLKEDNKKLLDYLTFYVDNFCFYDCCDRGCKCKHHEIPDFLEEIKNRGRK